MSIKRVTRFNHIVGNQPNMGTDKEYWDQIKLQAKLVLEEATEMYNAAMNEDMVEVADGWADVKYLNEYMEDILKAGDVRTDKVFDAVCTNNESKFSNSYNYVLDSVEVLKQNGTDAYVEESLYEGEIYYTARRSEDGKVLKLKHHERVDLSQFIPEIYK